MNEMLPVEWNGRTIRRREDGYFSATDMCQACGKLFADWARLDSTKEFLKELSAVMGIPITSEINGLIEVKQGGNQEQGTWIHSEVAIALAMWLAPKFHVLVVGLVRQWAEGKLVAAPVEEDPTIQMARGLIAAQKLLEEKDKKIEELVHEKEEVVKENEELKPDANGFRYLKQSEGSQSLTQTAKILGIPPRKFIYGLQEKRWIYKHPLSDVWLGYSNRTKNGDLEHVYHEYEGKDGQRRHRVQVLVTVQGTAKLAKMLGNGAGQWQLF